MKSKRLLLHIGTDKTGTTSIQETLHQATADGNLGDICYPQFKRHNHNFLAALYKPFDRLPRTYRLQYQQQGSEALARDAMEFKEELFDTIRGSRKTILSAEYLSRFSPDEVHALATDLVLLGIDEVLVVVYVRNPASHYLSNVQQTLKAASTFVPPVVWRHPIHQVLRVWSEEFDNMIVRPFARDRLVDGDAVRDFLSVASSFFGVDGGLDLPAFAENESISAEGMIVLQQYRKQFYSNAEDEYKRDSNELLQILLRSMGAFRQTRPSLSPSVEQLIIDRHRGDLEALWKEYGVDLRGDPVNGGVGSGPGHEDHEGPRRMSDLALILAEYDENVVRELMLYCMREALSEQQQRSAQQIVNLKSRISDLKKRTADLTGQLETSQRDAMSARQQLELAKTRLERTLASRSWRWGHRIMLILSSPRRLMRAIRRGKQQ